ncbi:MAG: nucleotidyltransferase domain-containing protein [Nitrospinae bacterium]|nr:nucleotidyltransferase domain-containing protein [Nitrospinota bacterium]
MIISDLVIPDTPVRELCRRYQVSELSLFGSTVTGSARQDSDVDILVAFRPEARIGFIEFSKLRQELSELLGRDVDLAPKDGLKDVIRDEVLSSAQVIYAE